MEAYSDRGEFFSDLEILFRRADGCPTVLTEKASAVQQKIEQAKSAEKPDVICDIEVDSSLVKDELDQIVADTVTGDNGEYYIPVRFNSASEQ